MPFFEKAWKLFLEFDAKRAEMRMAAREHCVCISIGEQKLWHFCNGAILAEHNISTSRAVPSCIPNSLGTPTGLHQIIEKIGADAPKDTVFIGRKSQGFTWQMAPENLQNQNLITSRILWLDGLENEKNRGQNGDTHARYIYIHGTNQEKKIGTPNSHGCILLNNTDVIKLFDAVPSGTFVWISLN